MKTRIHHSLLAASVAAVVTFGASTKLGLSKVYSADWPQWRGPQRDGSSSETGLLREWPKDGPRQIWKTTDAGLGYSAPSVVGERVFLLGNEGLENEFVRAISTRDGRTLWTTRLGKVGNPQQRPNFPAARSTPTVVDGHVIALSSDGDLVCLEVSTGKILWQKNLKSDFGGKAGQWAYAESPLVDGDLVVCTPGGPDATVLALKRHTGELAWKCATPEGDEAGYSSLVAVEVGGVRQYAQSLQKGLAGIDAKSGKLLWRYPKMVSRYGATIPTPLPVDQWIYAAANGTGGALVHLVSKGGSVVPEEQYFGAKLPTAIGGVVKVGKHLYGCTAQALQCVEFSTGNIKWEERSVGAASMVAAGGLLFLHGESGEVALVEPSPESYREKGRFTPADAPKRSDAMEKAWAYPALSDGRLYIREHGSLWCYSVK